MRWYKGHDHKELKAGFKTVYKFAWFPTKVGNYTVWMEKYSITYRWGQRYFTCIRTGVTLPGEGWIEHDRNLV